MTNYVWSGIIIISILYSIIFGNIIDLNNGILDSGKETITVITTMLASMCMWSGVLEVADKSGLLEKVSSLFKPLLSKLFYTKDSTILNYISINLIANMLGLGSCATPAGINAIKHMQKENDKKDLPTHDMCMFIIINLSSVQIFHIGVIAYRNEFGSLDPASIVLPALIGTTITTITGIILALYCRRLND